MASTGNYLLDHRNPHGDHFYASRRGRLLAIVVHVTAGLEDADTIDDHSAENTAAYAASTDRSVSWHSGSDSDSSLDLLPASYTAWQCVGYNSHTYGHEISKRTTDWRAMPAKWVDRTLWFAARHLAPKAAAAKVPARRATRAELDAAIAHAGEPVGFVAHHDLDPSRRTDPGVVGSLDTFPWGRFLGMVAGLPAVDVPTSPPSPLLWTKEDAVLIRARSEQTVWLLGYGKPMGVPDPPTLTRLQARHGEVVVLDDAAAKSWLAAAQ